MHRAVVFGFATTNRFILVVRLNAIPRKSAVVPVTARAHTAPSAHASAKSHYDKG